MSLVSSSECDLFSSRSDTPWHQQADELLCCSQLLSSIKERKGNGKLTEGFKPI